MSRLLRWSVVAFVVFLAASIVDEAAARPSLFTIEPIPDQTAPASVLFEVQARYTVEDEVCWMGGIAFSLTNSPEGMTISRDGKISWTPSTAQVGGSYQVSIHATAPTPPGAPCYGNPGEDSESFTVTVAPAPPPAAPVLPQGSVTFKRYTGLGDNVNFNTGIDSSAQVCGIVGAAALDGDINEDDSGNILQLYAYVSAGQWWIRADFRSHNDHESWDIDLMCTSAEVTHVGGPPSAKPLWFRNYSGLGDNVDFDTGISASAYACGIVGMAALGGDINENGSGTIVQSYMYQSAGTWRIRADFRSHHDHEDWNIHIFCASAEVAALGEPLPEKPIFLRAFNNLQNDSSTDTGISASAYVCGVVGLTAFDGDIEEHGAGAILQAFLYEADDRWHIRTDFRTHRNHEGWNVNLLCVAQGVAQPNPVVAAPETCVANVPLLFESIPGKVRPSPHYGSMQKYLGANNTLIPWPRYTSDFANDFGAGEHFQGIQRLHGEIGQYFVLSGGIKNGSPRRSQLIVFQMGSQSATGPWALPSYGYSYEFPSPLDRTVAVVDLDTALWHGGGIQAHGNLLVVPLTGDGSGSEVRFFDFSSPVDPREISAARLIRPDAKSYAAGLVRLPNQHYLTVVWDDHNLDFYTSLTSDLRDGFDAGFERVHKGDVIGGVEEDCGGISPAGCGTYQNVNFVAQCDGAMYLIGMRNTKKASPTVTGTDYADLYRIDWPGDDYSAAPLIHFIERKQFYCYNQQCNFGAGAGIYVADRDHLWLYGASHWLHNGNARYNFNEYSYY